MAYAALRAPGGREARMREASPLAMGRAAAKERAWTVLVRAAPPERRVRAASLGMSEGRLDRAGVAALRREDGGARAARGTAFGFVPLQGAVGIQGSAGAA